MTAATARTRVRCARTGGGAGALRLADQLELLIAGVEPSLAESALVEGIAKAARDDWHAAAFILSRRWPERWGDRDGLREPDGKPL